MLKESWAAQDALVLRVPGTVVPEEANYLVNPVHPDREVLEMGAAESFVFDQRLADASHPQAL